MDIGMVGLGRMGANMARRLVRGGHRCAAFDPSAEAVAALAKDGAVPAITRETLIAALSAPRVIWLMVPAAVVDGAIDALVPLLSPGDTIVDGGNSFFQDDIARAAKLRATGIHYVDVGVSGGVFGLDRGYCLMIGGESETVRRLEPIFKTLAPGAAGAAATAGREKIASTAEQGYLHCGASGAGHFVKMVHNAIEYGMMAAYAEGFNILKHANLGRATQTHGAAGAVPRRPRVPARRGAVRLPRLREQHSRGEPGFRWPVQSTR